MKFLTKVVGMGRAGSRRRKFEEKLMEQAWDNAGKQLDLAESFHEHRFEWLEVDWGVYAWVCECGEVGGLS